MADPYKPSRPFPWQRVPPPVLSAWRTYRRWKAKGPRLGDYAPVSTLELPAHARTRARVPAVNFHAHLGRWLHPRGGWMESPGDLLALMEACNVESMVNLDGRWGSELEDNLDRYDRAHPGRFFTFCHVDWRLLEQPSGPDLLAQSLERSVAAGARGLKIWKDLGMTVRAKGRLVKPDDPALGPLWETAGDLGVPVLVHVADPAAFFRPADGSNERLEELLRYHQMAAHHGGGPGGFQSLLSSLESAVARHPSTSFVAAHGLYAENLSRLSATLERHANLHVDIAWAHVQLGRQPRAARALIAQHPDRVLFGTDVFPLRAGILQVYFRFLETADEYFPYTDEPLPGSGRWNIYGLDLPPDVLEAVYRGNAARLLGMGRPVRSSQDRLSPTSSTP